MLRSGAGSPRHAGVPSLDEATDRRRMPSARISPRLRLARPSRLVSLGVEHRCDSSQAQSLFMEFLSALFRGLLGFLGDEQLPSGVIGVPHGAVSKRW